MRINKHFRLVFTVLVAGLALPITNAASQVQGVTSEGSPAPDERGDFDDRRNRYAMFEQFRGRLIESIGLEVRDVFSAPVDSSHDNGPKWIGRIGNGIHLNTRPWVLRNRLLFDEGDTLSPFLLRESERLLRESGLLVDARIIVGPNAAHPDRVDIMVVTRDRWSLALPLVYKPENNSGHVGLTEDNFLGFGHELDSQIDFDGEESRTGLRLNYRAANLFGSYVNVSTDIHSRHDLKNWGVDLSRNFFSTTTRWAGGVELDWTDKLEDDLRIPDLPSRVPVQFHQQAIWVGHALGLGQSTFGQKARLIVAASLVRFQHRKRPNLTGDLLGIFANSRLVLSSMGFSYRDYQQEHFLNGFGVTEDIPVGAMINLTGGFEDRESGNRAYMAIAIGYGGRIESLGYLHFNFSLAGFRGGGDWQQNTLKSMINYHTPLQERGGWKLRFLGRGSLVRGINRFPGESIRLNASEKVRGVNVDDLRGLQRAIVNLEGYLFSPWSLFGFGLGGNVFADFGKISQPQGDLIGNPVYQVFGGGLRIRNETLTRSTILLNAYYSPNHPAGDDFGFLFTSSVSFGIGDLAISRPEIEPFE